MSNFTRRRENALPQQRPIIMKIENNVRYAVLDYNDHDLQPREYISVQIHKE
jgi:hypothetical protein